MRTSTVRRLWMPWLDHCFAGPYVDQHFFGKTIGGVPAPWAEAIRALEQVLRTHRWTPRSAWAYNFRGIAGRPCSCSSYLSCSLHGSGVAIDIDPNLNPQSPGSPFIPGSFPLSLIRDVEAIHNEQGEQMFTWGGWWTVPDRMHFQARVGPTRTQVDWSTVAGSNGDDDVVLKRGDTGDLVEWYQAMLNHAGASPALTVDGDFGAKTEQAVKDEQAKQDVTATGEIDGPLAGYLASFSKRYAAEWGDSEPGPAGPPGPQGAQGPAGPRGPAGADAREPVGIVGTDIEFTYDD